MYNTKKATKLNSFAISMFDQKILMFMSYVN